MADDPQNPNPRNPGPSGQNPQRGELQIQAHPETAKGVFSNLVLIRHSREEFVLDFLLNIGGEAQLQSRVLLTPEHAKRFTAALSENLERFESGGMQAVNTHPA